MTVPMAVLLTLQVAQAGVTGTVRDELTGAPLAEAWVTLSEVDRHVLTGADGRFRFVGLAPGPHHVTIRRQGFRDRTLHALVPRSGFVELSVALQPLPLELAGLVVEQRMAIRGAERLDPDASSESVSLGAVRNHPLLAEADVFRVLEGGDVASLPESHGGLHVRGGAASHTSFELDGIPILGPLHAAGLFSAWNPDALSSVTLDSSTGGVLPSLSGTVSGATKSPGEDLHGSTVLSTTQARISVDGPFLERGGFVFSARGGLPSGVVPPKDPAKIRGEAGDLLGKLELSALGGDVEMLAYGSENELNSGAIADLPSGGPVGPRNRFEWSTRALGAVWARDIDRASLEVRIWDSRASGAVALERDSTALHNRRVERGVSATWMRRGEADGALRLGVRLSRGTTEYESTARSSFSSEGGLTTGTASVGFETALASGVRLEGEVLVAGSTLGVHSAPRLVLAIRPAAAWALSVSTSRRHQFAQSLRNEESLLGTVFPTDLFVSAGSDDVPVARADEVAARAEYRPASGLTVGARLYARRLESVVFVATRTGTLFSTGAFDVGSADITGLSLDGALSGSRYGVVADYAAQSVRNRVPGQSYVPSYAPTHRAQAGVVLHPTATLSVRMSHTAIWGRSSTALVGPVEWESCNLLDGGCELAGAPSHDTDLGGVSPGTYQRTDLGVRKHWHLGLGGRDSMLAVYGTVTNLFSRSNVMTLTVDSATGAQETVDMLPFAPLVLGLELVF